MSEALSILAVFAPAGAAVADRGDDLIAVLLIAFVASIVCGALIARFVIRRELHRRRARENPVFRHSPSIASGLFDAPNRWLAVRTHSPQAVQMALGLQNARACLWSDALAVRFEPRLFISPPVHGWVVVMGCDLPDPAGDIDQCYLFLTQLSEKLGEVQFFSRNRAVSHHGWARLDKGRVLRAYVWAGETLWNQGALTDAERNVRVRCLTYTESSQVLGLNEREILFANTDKVARISAAWSLDPTAVGGEMLDAKGIAGDLLHSRFH